MPPLDSSAFAWIVSHPWLYPLLSACHIVGIALLLGSLVLFELRVWGVGAALPVRALARHALRLTLAGFALAVVTGLGMALGQFDELLGKGVFQVKLSLVLVAGANAAVFHWRGGVERLDGVARLQTLFSTGLWLAIIICGRWIAFS
jgi:hypothetical protein